MARAPGLHLRDVVSNMRVTQRALEFCEADVASLDGISGLELLRSFGTTENMIDWFWRLASMAVMNVPIERCSAAALMRVHSQLIGHKGLHFGFPAVGLSRLYVEQSIRIIERAGGSVHLDSAVISVESKSQVHHVRTRDDEVECRHVVFAIPPDALAALAPGLADTSSFEPSPYKSVYLWFDRRVTGERFWTHLWSPERLNYDFYDLANIRPAMHDRPSIIASNIIYSHRAEAMSEADIVRATVKEIAGFAPAAAQARLLHADVHHIPMAIPCPLVGSESRRPPTVTQTPGVFLAGDWTRTQLPCSMEGAVRSGQLAAEAVLADMSVERSLAIAPRLNDGLARWLGGLRTRFANTPSRPS
jgi:15-cis-phytoene desaturase